MDVTEEQELRAAEILQAIAIQGATVFFEKPLTASDTAGSGRVVIPKAIAEQYFPKLEQPSGIPVRAVDTRGHEYTFKYRYWVNNQSRMYLLEGAGELHRQFNMSVGDVMVFAQKQDRTLMVAGRPATKNDVIRKAPVKKPQSSMSEQAKAKPRPDGKPKFPSKYPGAPQGGYPGQDKPKKKPKLNGTLSGQQEAEPPTDGIFRGAPATQIPIRQGVATGRGGRWVVTLDLAGEQYQAYFDTQEDALEAFNAAGGVSAKPGGTPGVPTQAPGAAQPSQPSGGPLDAAELAMDAALASAEAVMGGDVQMLDTAMME